MKVELTKEQLAKNEYDRLINAFKSTNVPEIKLIINDKWIMKIAELYADLELIKNLKSIIWSSKNPDDMKETAASKARIKYMAQYSSAMQKINKVLLSDTPSDDEEDDMSEYDD